MKKKIEKKNKRKKQILNLAESATSKINENKIITDTINIYSTQLQQIKVILCKYSNHSNITEQSLNELKKEFIYYFNNLHQEILQLRGSTAKINQKFQTNTDTIFDEFSQDKVTYKQSKIDNFLLQYSIKEKDDTIKKLKDGIHSAKDYNIFREPKRETETSKNYSENFLDKSNQENQQYLIYESKMYNKYSNRNEKKLLKIQKGRNMVKALKEIIEYLNQKLNNQKNNSMKYNNYDKKNNNINNKNNKIFSNKTTNKPNKKEKDVNNNYYNSINLTEIESRFKNYTSTEGTTDIPNDDKTFNLGNLGNFGMSLQNSNENNKNTKKNKGIKKINLLTVDELFDVNNDEGEKEAIIDDELHSDDEIVFPIIVKSKKKITVDYRELIKKKVPDIYLSQIEFNKSKVMNEADLYSYQKRKFKTQNVDENIRIMKKKIKILKRRIKINKEKLKAIQNFANSVKDSYNTLKPLKVQMSVKEEKINFMKKEFYKQNNKDVIDENDELNYQKELDDYLNDPELNDNYFSSIAKVNNTQRFPGKDNIMERNEIEEKKHKSHKRSYLGDDLDIKEEKAKSK